MLEGHYRWMALMLGLATSFHVLVGGWAFLAVEDSPETQNSFVDIGYLGSILIYLAASVLFGWWWSSYSPHPTGSVQPSYVYVFRDCLTT